MNVSCLKATTPHHSQFSISHFAPTSRQCHGVVLLVNIIYFLPLFVFLFFTSNLSSSVYKLVPKNKRKTQVKLHPFLYAFLLLLKAMDSSTKIVPNERDTKFPATNQLSSRRSQSFSSLSSCSSSLESSFSGDSPTSPVTPARFSGIPFSWEKIPGIPKKQASRKKENSPLSLLPLPPSTTPTPSKRFNHQDQETSTIRKKNNISESFRRDPFFAAFVECCKEDEDQETSPNIWKSSKVPRNLSDRLGLINIYTSCKRTCTVSESITLVPRSARSSYHILNRRSG